MKIGDNIEFFDKQSGERVLSVGLVHEKKDCPPEVYLQMVTSDINYLRCGGILNVFELARLSEWLEDALVFIRNYEEDLHDRKVAGQDTSE